MRSKYAAFIMLPFGILGLIMGIGIPLGIAILVDDKTSDSFMVGMIGGLMIGGFCIMVAGMMVGDGWRGWKAWRAGDERITMSDPYGGM